MLILKNVIFTKYWFQGRSSQNTGFLKMFKCWFPKIMVEQYGCFLVDELSMTETHSLNYIVSYTFSSKFTKCWFQMLILQNVKFTKNYFQVLDFLKCSSKLNFFSKLLDEINQNLSRFLRGQGLICRILSIYLFLKFCFYSKSIIIIWNKEMNVYCFW